MKKNSVEKETRKQRKLMENEAKDTARDRKKDSERKAENEDTVEVIITRSEEEKGERGKGEGKTEKVYGEY